MESINQRQSILVSTSITQDKNVFIDEVSRGIYSYMEHARSMIERL